MKPCWWHWDYKVIDGLPYEAHLKAAQKLLLRSIRASSRRRHVTVSDSTSSNSGITATEEFEEESSQQQQHGLRLHSFSSSLPTAVDMLAALQVQHLTCVELSSAHDARHPVTDSGALSGALVRLSNLQQLHLGHNADTGLGAALTTLVELPQLTLLEVNGQWLDRSMALQQLLGKPLLLRSLQLPVDMSYQLPVLNMALLTNLQSSELAVVY
jgi:hypothetical protein